MSLESDDSHSDEYDDPAVEAQWLKERRDQITEYLRGQGLRHGRIGQEPAWFMAPYVSIWAIESLNSPGKIGWWAIAGDLPTDYVSSSDARDPRGAMIAIASRWREVSHFMARGEKHPTCSIGTEANAAELAPLLSSRAELLLEIANDQDAWEHNEL